MYIGWLFLGIMVLWNRVFWYDRPPGIGPLSWWTGIYRDVLYSLNGQNRLDCNLSFRIIFIFSIHIKVKTTYIFSIQSGPLFLIFLFHIQKWVTHDPFSSFILFSVTNLSVLRSYDVTSQIWGVFRSHSGFRLALYFYFSVLYTKIPILSTLSHCLK